CEQRNSNAKTFWMELEGNGEVDLVFQKAQDVLQSLKQKIKDGSATNKEYIQAMILVNEATVNNSLLLVKDSIPGAQNEQENKSEVFPSTSCEDSIPEDCTVLSTERKEVLCLENKDFGGKEPPLNLSYQSHVCSGACLMKMPPTFKGENPLQLPIRCHFQRRHAKTNSHSSALHVSYKTPCGRSLRNMEEVFHYLLETECNFLFTDNFSFNTYVQLSRNSPKQEVVSDVDISNGVESVPISFCNEIDSRMLPQFKYRKTIWPRPYYLNNFSNMLFDSCDCSEGCIDIKKCACLQLTARNAKPYLSSSDRITTGYKYKRLQRQIPTGIYECNLLCKCNRQICQNRVVQHGPHLRLQVFKTEKKGWGVRCLDDIDRGTFVCIYSGRLFSRAKPENPKAIDGNGKKQNMEIFSKKRKVEVSCSDCEVEKNPPKCSSNPKQPIVELNYKNISRTQYDSVIRSPKSKTATVHHNRKKMGLVSSESVTLQDNDGLQTSQEHLNSKARRAHGRIISWVATSTKQPVESDVIVITCRKQSPPGNRRSQATTLDNENTKTNVELQIKESQEEKSASQSERVICDEASPHDTKNPSSDSPLRLNQEKVFLLDASKEGNVGRFLNHSCCPNLLVQNVFVETQDRNFPLVAFFTNRYVKARTELTWDYGYEAGTMADKEILCQCGANKCRKKII
uniref:Histone-lysine N-methyltransferase SETDB2 n=1 Tax=Jaculus jaculus TaxID=51337 RepID=A0A8C5NWW4_JACJA